MEHALPWLEFGFAILLAILGGISTLIGLAWKASTRVAKIEDKLDNVSERLERVEANQPPPRPVRYRAPVKAGRKTNLSP